MNALSEIKKAMKNLFTPGIVAEFPKEYPPECFDCNRENCIPSDCEKHLSRKKNLFITSDMIGREE